MHRKLCLSHITSVNNILLLDRFASLGFDEAAINCTPSPLEQCIKVVRMMNSVPFKVLYCLNILVMIVLFLHKTVKYIYMQSAPSSEQTK